MSTQLPPPKRQRTAYAKSVMPQVAPEPAPEIPAVVVQFKNAETGDNLGPAINLPADTGRDALQMLVNKLKGEQEDPMPYAFHLQPKPAADGTSPARLTIHESIMADALAPKASTSTSTSFSPEDVFEIWCEPQAVFRVRGVGRCSATLSGHGSPILCCAQSPTGRYAATGSGDATCRVWDMETETPKWTLAGHKGSVLCAEWEARERMLATGGYDGQVRLWDPKTGKQMGQPLMGHTKWIMSLAFEPTHLVAPGHMPRLATASKDGTVRVWNTGTRKLEFVLSGHAASVNVVRWGGENVIYTGSSDRTVKVWSGTTGKLIRSLNEHAHWVNTMALSTDFILRTGPFDHTGKVPKDDTEAREWALKRYAAATATSTEALITGSEDHTLFLWPDQASSSFSSAASPKKPLARLTGHQKQVNHVSFSPDGRFIASAGWDNAVKLWEGKTGKFVASLRGHVAAVYRVAWSADSRMLVSASKDTTLKLWNLKTFKIKTDLPGHTDEVWCVDFVADKVVSGGRDKTVKIWRH